MLTDSEIGKCYRYAYQVTQRTVDYYKQRNKYASTEKLITDHFFAKLCELHVYHYLTKLEYLCAYPEFTFRDEKNERVNKFTNDTDLIVIKNNEQLKIHIKCVRYDSPVTNSWLIEKKDSCVYNPQANEFFALCVFHSPDKIEIAKLIAATEIVWREPVGNLPTKSACYLCDM